MQAAPSTGYVALTSQVGGHPGVMSSEDGSLLIKPALPVEVNFYQTVLSDPHFEPLRPFIPKFYGTLRLEGALDHEKNMEGQFPIKQDAKEIEGLEKDSIVLENLSHTFLKPNILDVKLGTVLYDESASEEKRARMEKTARETTSLETGVRLTGFQVYDTHKDVAVNTPKSYGKSIKASDLPDGIARFFPVVPEDDATKPTPTTAAATSPDAEPATGTGLPKDLLLPILESLREDIAEIRTALANVEMRMVGGSLLIVYEADLDRARAGLTAWLGGDGDENEDEDEDEDEDDEDTKKPGPPYVVKLIDFAHTRLAPGEGPDQGVLLGVDTVLKLLDGRINQVKALA